MVRVRVWALGAQELFYCVDSVGTYDHDVFPRKIGPQTSNSLLQMDYLIHKYFIYPEATSRLLPNKSDMSGQKGNARLLTNFLGFLVKSSNFQDSEDS